MPKEAVNERNQRTLNICKSNFDAEILVLCCFIGIAIVISCLLRRKRKFNGRKSPMPVLFYLAKTAYHPDHYRFCVTLLQKEKYDVNFLDSEEKLSLFLCSCLSGSAELVAFMIKQGANVQSVSHYGDSALYLAVFAYVNGKSFDLKTLNLLLAAGCDINHQNDGGYTVLHLASSKGIMNLVKYLVLQGADATARNKNGELPVDAALIEDVSEVPRNFDTRVNEAVLLYIYGEHSFLLGHADVAAFLMERNGQRNSSQSVYF